MSANGNEPKDVPAHGVQPQQKPNAKNRGGTYQRIGVTPAVLHHLDSHMNAHDRFINKIKSRGLCGKAGGGNEINGIPSCAELRKEMFEAQSISLGAAGPPSGDWDGTSSATGNTVNSAGGGFLSSYLGSSRNERSEISVQSVAPLSEGHGSQNSRHDQELDQVSVASNNFSKETGEVEFLASRTLIRGSDN
jgi:hypothetical protein